MLIYICSRCEADFEKYLEPCYQLNNKRDWWCHCCDTQCELRCREVRNSDLFIQHVFTMMRIRKERIEQLKEELEDCKLDVKRLEAHIKYMPGGEGALEAMQDFTERANSYK